MGKQAPIVRALERSPFYTIKDAAEYLGLSESYVQKIVGAREITVYKVGSRTILHRDDMIEWMNRHKRKRV